MNPFNRIAALLILVAALGACSSTPLTTRNADDSLAQLEDRANRVTIVRDDFGIPHIYAKTDADAVFGMLYAQAEDDFHRIERNYLWAIGRLAEVDGKQAIYSDLRARLYMTTQEARSAYAASPPWLQDLCVAFAEGLNYYLATHPEVKPELIDKFEPWMPMFFFEGSIGGDIEQIPLAGIEAFYGGHADSSLSPQAVAPQAVSPQVWIKERGVDREPRGSNGFAISGEHTRSGNTLLLINPHTSFYFRGEIHVSSEQGLNAYGAVTWGQFFVYQGFNANTGWMHTSTGADFMDEFVEDVFQHDGQLVYRYGDELRPVKTGQVTLDYRQGDQLKQRTFKTYHTHHGPITHQLDGKWVATKINWDPVNALKQSFTRTTQSGYRGFNEMMAIRTNSSNNTVYADSEGNIAYYHGNFLPRRSVKFDYQAPVDGSNPETDWQGAHNLDEIITILNPANGWIQNCNSTPFTAAAGASPVPADYPVYMAPEADNFRGLHAVQMLTGQSDLTLDKLIDIAYDPYLPGFSALIAGLINAYDRSANKQDYPSAAIDYLRTWDHRVAADSVAMTLAHYYGTTYLGVGLNPQNLRGMALVNYLGGQSPDEERLAIFSKTIAGLKADFDHWEIPWGEVNRFQRLTGDISQPHDDDAPSLPVGMASGRWGALASFGARQYPGTRKLYGNSGNSFVAVVEFGERVKARTLLAGGQSGDPTSEHFDDQAARYVEHSFKEVAYYPEDVKKRAVRTYHPGE